MAVYELKNDVIAILIDSHGAELKSLKKLSTGTEYMWCGDAKYWGRTSPVLFPFVGSLNNKEYKVNGKTYPMNQHGFARDMEFTLIGEGKTPEGLPEIWFELKSDEETLKKYPYEFVLKLGYRLDANKVEVLWQVENPAGAELRFFIGGHPAFNCPIEEGTKQSDYFVSFGDLDEVVSSRIGEKGLVNGCMDVYGLTGGKLAITENLFDHDALVIEEEQTGYVALCKKDGTPYLEISMDAPLFGVWSPPGKQAPFVCLEPWYGRCDSEYFDGELAEREWGNLLAGGEVWKASYVITV
ncbi:MAG: aldose 1-epimerase family protein [Lachnospiraceae bacterium]|nr:aldose 1-epimerase family protein [Lachnospiraceae bacterium]